MKRIVINRSYDEFCISHKALIRLRELGQPQAPTETDRGAYWPQAAGPREPSLNQYGKLIPRDDENLVRVVEELREAADGLHYVQSAIERLDPATDTVTLSNGEVLSYDVCIVATGTRIVPEDLEGLTGPGWGEKMHEFYTLEGALKLEKALREFKGGRVVLNVVEMPIKCPVAPMEFLFLADEHFQKRGIRDQVELVLVTPLDGAFTKPMCNKVLSHLIREKGIRVETDFATGEVDADGRKHVSYDEREVAYDLQVSVPVHGGAEFVDFAHPAGTDARGDLVRPEPGARRERDAFTLRRSRRLQ